MANRLVLRWPILVLTAGYAWAAPTQISTVDAQDLPVPQAIVVIRHLATGQEIRCETKQESSCTVDLTRQGGYLIRAMAGELEGQALLEGASTDSSGRSLIVRMNPVALRTSITVVSGSRQEELQQDSPVRVDVMTRTDMLATGYERVSDILQEMPGVLVRRGSTSTVGGEQIQGIDSRQVAVLQDGLPVPGARGIKSGALNLNRQSSDRLARVEVAKGAASSTYGSDAMGGVINMITREPSTPIQGGVVFSGGTLGMFDGRGDLGGRQGRWTYFLNLGQNRLDSYRLIPTSPTTVGPDLRRQDGLGKLRYQFHPKFSLGFTANGYRNREEGLNASETGFVIGRSRDSTQSYALVADWTIDNSTFLQARAYRSRYDESSLAIPANGVGASSPANLNERLGRLDATLSRQLGSRNYLQGGVEWAQNKYRGANRVLGDNIGQQVTSTDVWLQDKWTANRFLTLTAGGRITKHSLFGSAAVPKVGAIVKVNDALTLRGSFGLGFRAPDLGQLYFRFLNPTNFYQVMGNPNLKPEHSQSIQVGSVYTQRRYRFGLTLFRNNIRDLIDAPLAGTPRTTAELSALVTAYSLPTGFDPFVNRQLFIYVNFAKVRTQGVELDGAVSLTRNLRASAAYTFLQALNGVTHAPLTQRHRHNGQVRLEYSLRRLGLSANIRGSFYSHWILNAATGTRGLPFKIFDAYVAKDWARGFQTFVAIDNLNNSRDRKLQLATPTFDRPDYGRTARIGLRYRFGGGE